MFLALYYILKEAQAHLSRQKKIIPSMYVTIAAVREDFFLQPSCFCARHMNDPFFQKIRTVVFYVIVL